MSEQRDPEVGGPADNSTRAWSKIYVENTGHFSGEVVGFDAKKIVIALDIPRVIIPGRHAILALGVGSTESEGVQGTTLASTLHPDGRSCVVVELDEVIPPTEPGAIPERRSKTRVPFEVKVDAMVVASRKRGDTNYRFTSYDLSSRGMGVYCDRDVPTRASVLLRFAVPPHRGTTMQIRAIVAHVRKIDDERYHIGLEFDRVTNAQLQQLNNAIMHVSHPTKTVQATPTKRASAS